MSRNNNINVTVFKQTIKELEAALVAAINESAQTQNQPSENHNAGPISGFVQKQYEEAQETLRGMLSLSSVVTEVVSKTKEALTELKAVDSQLANIGKENHSLSKNDLQSLGNDSFDIAGSYGKKASDYLAEYQQMKRAGYDNARQMAELSLAAQNANHITSELANQYITTADNIYHLNGSYQALINILDGASNIAGNHTVSMEELAEGITIAGNHAVAAGIQVNELTAILAATNVSTQLSSSEVAHSLNAIFSNLMQVKNAEEGIDAKGLKRYKDACAGLNVSLQETKDGFTTMRDPLEILKELSQEYSKLSDNSTQKRSLLSSVNDDSTAQTLDALLSNYDLYETFLQEYENSGGTMSKMAEITTNTWEGSLNRLSNTWTDTIGNIVQSDTVVTAINSLNGLLSILNKLTGVLDTAGNHGNAFNNMIGSMKIGGAIGTVMGAMNLGKSTLGCRFQNNFLCFEYALHA